MGFDWENDDSDLLNHKAVDKLLKNYPPRRNKTYRRSMGGTFRSGGMIARCGEGSEQILIPLSRDSLGD
jgi:hypothetical protein